jgi:hypothetical protein
MRILSRWLAIAVCFGILAVNAPAQQSKPPVAPAQAAPENPDPWPKAAMQGGTKYTMYQPQLDSWDQFDLTAHAAVSVLPPDAQNPLFGVNHITEDMEDMGSGP